MITLYLNKINYLNSNSTPCNNLKKSIKNTPKKKKNSEEYKKL